MSDELSAEETIDALYTEIHRLRQLITLMSEHAEQRVAYITLALDGQEKVAVIVTHSVEDDEPGFAKAIGEKVQEVMDKLSEPLPAEGKP